MNRQLIFFVFAIAIVLICCTVSSKKKEMLFGLNMTNIDTTTKPTNDFCKFVDGNRLKNNPIPESESLLDSLNELNEKNTAKLKSILNVAFVDKKTVKGGNFKKNDDFFSEEIDSVKLNTEAPSLLKEEFELIEKIATKDDFIKAIAHLHTVGVSALFVGYVAQDPKDNTLYIPQFHQGGISLPDRDYYTNKDERTLEIQKTYLEHLVNMFKLLGDKPELAEKNAKIVFNIETNLAKASMTNIELGDHEKQYNKKTFKELTELTPSVNWACYLRGVGVTRLTDVIVCQPAFFREICRSTKEVSISDWKTYLRWTVINQTAKKLGNDFVKEQHKFSTYLLI